MDREALIGRIEAGETFDYLLFYGHTAKDGRVGPTCMSQWYPAPFEVDGVRYLTAEHWMMAEKARLFGDPDVLEEILAALTPREAKALGREVDGFDQATWERERFGIVVRGNREKFGQNQELARFLRETHDRVLVEASPTDRIWGIGLGRDHPNATHPARWRGLNLLGFALMEVRSALP